MVKNEEDASMALQVSNALTQALLNYRIKHMPAEVSYNIQCMNKFVEEGSFSSLKLHPTLRIDMIF